MRHLAFAMENYETEAFDGDCYRADFAGNILGHLGQAVADTVIVAVRSQVDV
jgi:hypothetical protein